MRYVDKGIYHVYKLILRTVTLIAMVLYPLVFLVCRGFEGDDQLPFWLDFTSGYSELWKIFKNGFV